MPQKKNLDHHIFIVAVVLSCLWLCLWPGDVSFNVDEPVFMQMALRHNAAGTWAKYTLTGTKYMPYGPGAVWFYQLILHITHNPVWLGLIRGLAVTAMTALGLSWLARGAALPLWGGVFALLSPYLYIYSRQLWDNNFLIPFVALLLGAYARFMAEPTRRWFLVCVYSAAILFLTHLMSLSVLIPVACHAAWFQRRWLWKHKGVVAVAILSVGLLMGFYLRHLYAAFLKAPPMTGQRGEWAAWFFPWQGWHFFSVFGLEHFFDSPWVDYACGGGGGCKLVEWLTELSLPLFLAGVAVVIGRVVKALRGQRAFNSVDHMDALCLGILLFAMVFNGKLQTFRQPHYHNGSWVVWYYFLWRGLAALLGRWPRWGRLTVATYGGALVVALVLLAGAIHKNGGARTRAFGTVLVEQVRIARELHAWSPQAQKTTRIDGPLMDYFPLEFIGDLMEWKGTPGGHGTTPVVRYRSGPAGTDAWLSSE